MVIVESPDPVRAGGFEVVCALEFAQKLGVAREDSQGERWKCGRGEQGESVEAEKPHDEVKLVARSIVYTLSVTERVVKVS